MADYEKIIKLLDGADLFLRNRANSEPATLNEYDIELMLDIAKVCDEAARIIENSTSSVNETTIKKKILEDFVLEARWKAWYDSDYEDYLLTKDDLEDVKNKMMREE